MNMLGLIENVLLLVWVMATTWILLDLRSKVYAMEARRAAVWDALTDSSLDPNQTSLKDFPLEDEEE